LGPREDRPRLHGVPTLPAVRTICRDAASSRRRARPTRSARGTDLRRPRGGCAPPERGTAPAPSRAPAVRGGCLGGAGGARVKDAPSTDIPGGITAPLGFRAAGVSCGIKARGLDLALLASAVPASGTAVLTNDCSTAGPDLV